MIAILCMSIHLETHAITLPSSTTTEGSSLTHKLTHKLQANVLIYTRTTFVKHIALSTIPDLHTSFTSNYDTTEY